MYSTRLHPSTLSKLDKIKQATEGKPISRILEELIEAEYARIVR